MRETCFRELYFLCLVVWCLSGFYSDVECYPLIDCGHDGDFTQYTFEKKKRTGERRNPKKPRRPRKTTLVDDGRIIFLEMKKLFTIVGQMKNILREGSAMQSSLCGLVWGDQNKEQIQNVFKRFLFHYSKAQNSVGTVERESHSVHPLMRLSPKFTLRRKKQQVLSRH